MKNHNNTYVSNHYLGEKGREYTETGGPPGGIGAKLQAAFFQPFISSEDIVLDFGCGKGGLASCLKCKRIDGFDVNVHQLEYASKHFAKTFSEYTDPPLGFYDAVYSNHALEHTPLPLLALKKVYDWLKPGGCAVFIVPHDCVRDHHQCAFDPNDRDYHLYTWTPRSLSNLFTEAGFDVQMSKVLKSAWHPRLFPIHEMPILGPLSRRFVCYILGRPQILCCSKKPC